MAPPDAAGAPGARASGRNSAPRRAFEPAAGIGAAAAPGLPSPAIDRNRTVLRITTTIRDGLTWLELEGRLAGPWVDELAGELEGARAAARTAGLPLALDLAAVHFADARGVALLRAQHAAGLVHRSSSFVTELLLGEELP